MKRLYHLKSPETALKQFNYLLFRLEYKYAALDYPEYGDIYATKKSKKQRLQPETNYHYTAFIPFNDGIWELDGYNKTPVKCGNIDKVFLYK